MNIYMKIFFFFLAHRMYSQDIKVVDDLSTIINYANDYEQNNNKNKVKLLVIDLDNTLVHMDFDDEHTFWTSEKLIDALIRLKALNYKLYVISRSDLNSIYKKLKRVELTNFFTEVMSTKFDGKNLKKSDLLDDIIDNNGGKKRIGHIIFIDDKILEVNDIKDYTNSNALNCDLIHFELGKIVYDFRSLVIYSYWYRLGEFKFRDTIKENLFGNLLEQIQYRGSGIIINLSDLRDDGTLERIYRFFTEYLFYLR